MVVGFTVAGKIRGRVAHLRIDGNVVLRETPVRNRKQRVGQRGPAGTDVGNAVRQAVAAIADALRDMGVRPA